MKKRGHKQMLKNRLRSAIGQWWPARQIARSLRRRRSAGRRTGDRARAVGDWSAAATAYAAHLRLEPGDVAIWIQLGHMRKEQGDLSAAERAYHEALSLAPDNGDLLLSLGHLSKIAGQPEQAATFFWRSFLQDGNAAAARELAEPTIWPHLQHLRPDTIVATELTGLPRPVVPRGTLERMDGFTASGWAFDPVEAARLIFFQDGRLVGRSTADRFRPDIAFTGQADPLSGFDAPLDLDFSSSSTVEVVARNERTGQLLIGSPLTASAPAGLTEWLSGAGNATADELGMLKATANHGLAGRLSIVMPIHNPHPAWLREALASVRGQWCDAWELICVDDCSTDPRIAEILAEESRQDARIRPILLERNVGIAAATNHGIRLACGEYVGFLDHDDVLEPEAVGRMLQAANDGADLIYSDEAVTGDNINAVRHVVARPAFSYDYYLNHPYFVHFIVVRRSLAADLRWDETMAISADVDFILRVLERARSVTHVPVALYRWRTHAKSTGHAKQGEVTTATIAALNRHLERTEQSGTASAGTSFNCHRIDFADDPRMTAIIIPTRNRPDLLSTALESIWRTTDETTTRIVVIDHQSDDPAFHRYMATVRDRVSVVDYVGSFNFARMNNKAVAAIGPDVKYLLFMNNDVEAIEPEWLEHMRGLCARGQVGVVGATLLYPDRRIQHAGVVLGLNGPAEHAHKLRPFMLPNGIRNPGYNGSLASTRDYLAVTAACMMVRREVFAMVDGFDERFEIGFNDADFCLRIGQRGLAVLNDAHAVLVHHESATRDGDAEMRHPADTRLFYRRWHGLMGGADPFYNPMLSLSAPYDHEHALLDRYGAEPRTRPVRLASATGAISE